MWCDLPKIVNMKCTPEVYSRIQTIQNLVAATETLISTFIWRDFQNWTIDPSGKFESFEICFQSKLCMHARSSCILCAENKAIKVWSLEKKRYFISKIVYLPTVRKNREIGNFLKSLEECSILTVKGHYIFWNRMFF